jgi:hypothetical protein
MKIKLSWILADTMVSEDIDVIMKTVAEWTHVQESGVCDSVPMEENL